MDSCVPSWAQIERCAMCGDPYGFMCDECFGNMSESGIDTEEFTEEHLCDICKISAKLYWEDADDGDSE